MTEQSSAWSCRICGSTRGQNAASKCLDCAARQQREWQAQFRAKHPEEWKRRKRATHLKSQFGLTIEQFDAMWRAQGERCALCGGDGKCGESRDYHPHVDHDHKTGKVRGILCPQCNRALGRVENVGLEKVLAYLGV